MERCISAYVLFLFAVAAVAQPFENDLTLDRAYLADPHAAFDDPTGRNQEYRTMPIEQAAPVILGATIENSGTAYQTNITLTCTFSQGGNTLASYTSTALPFLAPGGRDTLVLPTDFQPSAPGEVTVSFAVSADQVDDAPGNNYTEQVVVYTDPGFEGNSWGQDSRSTEGSIPLGATQLQSAVGTRIQIRQPGSFAYGIAVQFVNGTSGGAIALAQLVKLGEGVVAEGDLFEILPWHLGGTGSNTVAIIYFTEIIELEAQADYAALVTNPNFDTVLVGLSGTLRPGGLFLLDNEAQIIHNNMEEDAPAPMVRLLLGYPGSVRPITTSGLALGDPMPNPYHRDTRVPFRLYEARRVTYEVRDMNGKLMHARDRGRLPPGEHVVELDRMGLGAGTYILVLAAGGEQVSRQIILLDGPAGW